MVLAVQAPPPLPPPPDAELVAIEITWEGVGAYYKGFFQDQAKLTRLSEDLAPWLEGPVQLFIRYDSENFIGHILIQVPPGALRAPPRVSDEGLMLSDLAGVTTALATYRNALAASYDVRLQSFVIGVDFYRGPVHCRVSSAGDPPHDGTRVSPCPMVNGAETCGRVGPGGVVFADEAQKKLEGCLSD